MNQRIRYTGIPTGNPLVNALMVFVGALAVGAMILLGIVAFLVVASILLVLAGIVGIRVWWHRRKFRQAFGDGSGPDRRAGGNRVIEGEYHPVSTTDERKRQRTD